MNPISSKKPPRSIPIALPTTGQQEWEALKEPIMNGWLTQGPKVAQFEKAFAQRVGAGHAIASTSCTTGLHLILAGMGIGPGDEVIVPSFTWIACANVVLHVGATPVLADVDRATFNLDPAGLAKLRTGRTKAVMAVHLFGLCADVDAIAQALPGVPIIEDAACAAGSTYKGRAAGTMGAAGAFSFHPRKSITTGEGGMVTTNDDKLAERITCLRNHGASIPEEVRHRSPRPFDMPEFNLLGFNYRMTDLQGAVGLVQLSRLDAILAERQRWADYYRQELSRLGWLRLPQVPAGWTHGWQAYVCYVGEDAPLGRDALMEQLHEKGVSTRLGTHAIHTLGYYRDRFKYKPADFPGSRDCQERSMAIPLHNRMTEEDFAHVVDCIQKAR